MQFFQNFHYEAFEQPKPNLDDNVTRNERLEVRRAFLELDTMLWPHINASNWDIHRHRQPAHYVSSDHFIFLPDGTPIVKYIDGMWLHYGKSPEQLDFLKLIGGFDYKYRNDEDYYNAFYLHTRIQFYINKDFFRCWLLLATDKNYYDRSELLRRLYRNKKDQDTFYSLITPLFDKGFFYEIDDDILLLNSGVTKNEFIKFVKKDRAGAYSGIVKEYQPNDIHISVINIGAEMINNLNLLYPIYNFIAWRP